MLPRPDTGQVAQGVSEKVPACRASLEYLKVSQAQPDILHVHEWQCAAVPMLYWEAYSKAGLPGARLVLTIHCMDNSGCVGCSSRSSPGWLCLRWLHLQRAQQAALCSQSPTRMQHMLMACCGAGSAERTSLHSQVPPVWRQWKAHLLGSLGAPGLAPPAADLLRLICPSFPGMPGLAFAQSDKALDDRTIGHNPERLSLLKVGTAFNPPKAPAVCPCLNSASAPADCVALTVCAPASAPHHVTLASSLQPAGCSKGQAFCCLHHQLPT